ncbi:MAG: glycosyltransferase [Salinivirgaceae bacterium]
MDKNKNRAICHLTSVHPPFDIRIFYKECVSLARAGYQTSLIAPIGEETIKNGVRVVPIKLPENRLLRILIAPFRMFRLAIQQKAAIYHFHDPELMLTGILLRLAGKKVLYDIHENNRLNILDKEYLGTFFKSVFYWGYLWFEKLAILFYHQLVLALSEETYRQYYSEKKSTVVLNFPLYKDIIIKNSDIKANIRFVYAGVVHPTRGVVFMIELIARLNEKGLNASLDLVGAIRPDGFFEEIQKLSKDYHITEKVNIHGFVDAPDVSKYLAGADFGLVFLYPYLRYKEALPTKIFEYMQQGLPVITNDFPLYKNYVEEMQTGICIDIEKLDEAINRILLLLDNPNSCQQMAQNGIELTQNRFNWSTQEAKLLELYASL